MFTDFYALLGIEPRADVAEIDRAFRREIKKAHPDKHRGGLAASERTRLLLEARRTLKDPVARRVYNGRWQLNRMACPTREAARPSPATGPRCTSTAPSGSKPDTKPTVWTAQPAPAPKPTPPPRAGSGGGLGAGLGILTLLLGGAYVYSRTNTYDQNVGRYRGRNGTFRSGRWR